MSTADPLNDRNVLVDAARVLSVAMVVIFHAGLWRVTRDDGRWSAHTMELGPIGWYGSWLLMVMPVFFLCGGYAHAIVIDKMRARGTGLGHYLANRGRRLVGPTTVFITFFTVPSTLAAWLGRREDAVFISHNLTKLLWFLVTYLVTVLVAPLMVAWHDRSRWSAPLALVAAGTAVDLWAMRLDNLDVRYLNLVFVWLACHQLGIMWQRGLWRAGPLWHCWAAIGVGVAGIVALVNSGWPLPALGMGSRWVSNLQPPTVAMAWLALAQVGALGLLGRRRLEVLRSPAVQKVMGAANALLMTVYLWHMPCVAVTFGVFIGLGMLMPQMAWLFSLPLLALTLAIPLIALVVPRVARWDLRLVPPLGQHQNGPLAGAALVLLTLSLVGVWRHGLVIHPAEPLSSLGVLGVWLGSWLLARAANWRPDAQPSPDPQVEVSRSLHLQGGQAGR